MVRGSKKSCIKGADKAFVHAKKDVIVKSPANQSIDPTQNRRQDECLREKRSV